MYKIVIKYTNDKEIINIYEDYDTALTAIKNYILIDTVKTTSIERIIKE